MAERFFRATALAGDLHLTDFYDWDAWETRQLQYRDEAEVKWLMRMGAGEHRIVRTVESLTPLLRTLSLRAAFTSTSANASSERRSAGGKR